MIYVYSKDNKEFEQNKKKLQAQLKLSYPFERSEKIEALVNKCIDNDKKMREGD
ncbi:hypothetical protein [Clostridium beijerinckii]|uniref:hypothetical protein n=1 Tax=Clostridium beijerinckii TaxID=1520 RepID=UPI0013612D5B|nr:hypothetical protein [Clostridium beijerinckii]MZK53641.1 hypothetical protein [Clostridium beijerinckii]MZK61752.1 hypothetical protein [Clostridium beijerinckii]MZK71951.1 hypothetical protein [Clostridium beijerinckii]MZK77338.1 hypothetical protein [Clostridium beijerinckii]MZK86922.1 hypothetical protein [Clostridium beijerinckii]